MEKSDEPFALSHKMTGISLEKIGEISGPRCCKRDLISVLCTIGETGKENNEEDYIEISVCPWPSEKNSTGFFEILI